MRHFMVSCTSYLGRVIESDSPIKNHRVEQGTDGARSLVLSEGEYLMYAELVFKHVRGIGA